MGASNFDGPIYAYGNMAQLLAATFGTGNGVPDPNQDAGPNGVFQGVGVLDVRYPFLKDKVQGYTGMVQAALTAPQMISVNAIPAALAANNICAAQAVTSGTAMTLASTSAGITPNVPIVPFSGSLNAGTAVSVMALDFGFAFGTVVAASTTVTVADSSLFWPGMPIVIEGVGNAAGTTALLTNVLTTPTSTTITIADSPLASLNPAAIGTGNLWGPTETSAIFPTPTGAYPFLAGGPGLFLDPRQGIARCVRCVGPGGGAAGNFLVRGYDIYGQAMSELIAVASGSNTVYGTKAFKYIASVTPDFTSASLYTVGTSDVFGLAYRALNAESTTVWWAGSLMVSTQGFTAAATTSPATTTTDDVRGTIQTGTGGGGTGIGSTASNGTVSSLAMTGRRLAMSQVIQPFNALAATVANPVTLYGVTQA